jgi:hypothetical protein
LNSPFELSCRASSCYYQYFLFGFPNKALEKSYKMEYNLYYKMICYHGLVRFSERKAVFT